MDDAHAVGARESVHELRAEIHEAADGHGALREDLPQGLSRDELHREVRHARGLPDLVDGHDVRMIQRGGRARLLREPEESLAVRQETGGQDFQGHVAAEPAVRARYTSPIDPDPSGARISKGPRRVPVARGTDERIRQRAGHERPTTPE